MILPKHSRVNNYYLYNPVYTILLVFVFLASCNGQENAVTHQDPKSLKPIPVIVRKEKAVAIAPDFDTTLVSQYIRSIFQDSKGNLWFGTLGEGVVRYDVKTLTYFSSPDGFICSTVYAINEDRHGNLWFGTDQGVYKYDGRTFRNYDQKDGLEQIDISRKGILVDKSGTIWIGTHSGVYQYNPSADGKGGKSFSLFPLLPLINVTGIMEDHAGNIWFASSDKGVFRYNPSAYLDSTQQMPVKASANAITNIAEKEDLGKNYAGGIAQDKAGNIWFTMKNGICKYDGITFTEYTTKDGLGGTEFWGIYIEESGIIWVTARGSTTRFDPSASLPNPGSFKVFTVADGINCCVQSMYQDKEGKMWFGAGSGLFRFDGKRFYQVTKKGPW